MPFMPKFLIAINVQTWKHGDYKDQFGTNVSDYNVYIITHL